MHKDRLKYHFIEVSNITAVCTSLHIDSNENNEGLVIGKSYKVTHIGVRTSHTDVLLEEFGLRRFNSTCFDLYENGVPLGNDYVMDPRFFSLELRKFYKCTKPGLMEELEKYIKSKKL